MSEKPKRTLSPTVALLGVLLTAIGIIGGMQLLILERINGLASPQQVKVVPVKTLDVPAKAVKAKQ